MKKLLLPTLAFVVFLLVCSCDAKAISDEEIVNAMLDLLPTPETIPVPPNFDVNATYLYQRNAKATRPGEVYAAIFEGSIYTVGEGMVSGKAIWGETADGRKYAAFFYHEAKLYMGITIAKGWDLSWALKPTNDTEIIEQDETHWIGFIITRDYTDIPPPSNYSTEMATWERATLSMAHYCGYCGDYLFRIYVRYQLYTSLKKNYIHDAEISYEKDPDSYLLTFEEMKSFGIQVVKNYMENIYNTLHPLIKQLAGEEEQEEQQEKQEGEQEEPKEMNITFLMEYKFDIATGKSEIVPFFEPLSYTLDYNFSVKHVATGVERFLTFSDLDLDGNISADDLFDKSLINATNDNRFQIIIYSICCQDKTWKEKLNDSSGDLLPTIAKIHCMPVLNDKGQYTTIVIEKAINCWIDVGNGWQIIEKPTEAPNGFKIKVRIIPAWEELLRHCVYRFLQESNFYNIVSNANKFDLNKIKDIPILYYRGRTAAYDPYADEIRLSQAAGDLYRKNGDFDAIFHEVAHAIKQHAYHYVDGDIEDYLDIDHINTYQITNIYFAFEEAHSCFFASLMVDYVKEKKLIDDYYLPSNNYFSSPVYFNKEGDKMEGAVAGFLLNGLYLNYVKKKYDDAQTKTYEIFAKACELCNKYLKHYPYSIHDVIPFIVAIEPECRYELSIVDLTWNGGYNCGVYLHGNLYVGEIEGLYGYPLLIAVESSWFTSVEVNVNNTPYTVEEPDYGATDVSDGMACCIFIEKNTRIEADFSQGDGVYMILFNLNGDPMEEILAMYKWIGKAIIEIEKDGIKVVQGSVIVKSNAGTTYKAGDKIKITPHSEFVLSVENETALVYVMNGSVGVDNGISYEEVEKNKKAVVTEESIDVSSYKDKELDDIWDNFGEAMETLGIEKEEGNGGKQPGFEFVAITTAIAVIIWLRRKKTNG